MRYRCEWFLRCRSVTQGSKCVFKKEKKVRKRRLVLQDVQKSTKLVQYCSTCTVYRLFIELYEEYTELHHKLLVQNGRTIRIVAVHPSRDVPCLLAALSAYLSNSAWVYCIYTQYVRYNNKICCRICSSTSGCRRTDSATLLRCERYAEIQICAFQTGSFTRARMRSPLFCASLLLIGACPRRGSHHGASDLVYSRSCAPWAIMAGRDAPWAVRVNGEMASK